MPKVTNQLTNLLVESGFVTEEEVDKAAQRSEQTGLPIGRILVLGNNIDEKTLVAVLEVMLHLRDNAMFTEGDALEILGLYKAELDGKIKDADKGQVKTFFSRKNRPIRIGELLVRSGLVTETDALNAVEEGFATRRKVGQVLAGNSFITVDALEMSLNLLKSVQTGEVDATEAAKTLREAHSYPEGEDDDEG